MKIGKKALGPGYHKSRLVEDGDILNKDELSRKKDNLWRTYVYL